MPLIQLIYSSGSTAMLNTMKSKLSIKSRCKRLMVLTSKSPKLVLVELKARERRIKMRKTKRKTLSISIKADLKSLLPHLPNLKLFQKIQRKRDFVNRKMLRHSLKRDKKRQLRVLRRLLLKL